jgi:hemoglobin
VTAHGPTIYERAGGAAFFAELVDAFYDGVAGDDVLAALYPERPDFSGARRRLTQFLVQYWGGPSDYSVERGHPRLRMRHLRFGIGPAERDRWLAHMTAAVEAATTGLEDGTEIAAELLGYFRSTAEHLRNDTGLPITSASFRGVV